MNILQAMMTTDGDMMVKVLILLTMKLVSDGDDHPPLMMATEGDVIVTNYSYNVSVYIYRK